MAKIERRPNRISERPWSWPWPPPMRTPAGGTTGPPFAGWKSPQELNIALPAEYAEKRREWEAAASTSR